MRLLIETTCAEWNSSSAPSAERYWQSPPLFAKLSLPVASVGTNITRARTQRNVITTKYRKSLQTSAPMLTYQTAQACMRTTARCMCMCISKTPHFGRKVSMMQLEFHGAQRARACCQFLPRTKDRNILVLQPKTAPCSHTQHIESVHAS